MSEQECGDGGCCGCSYCVAKEATDGRVTITIDFPDRDFLFNCFMAAHEADLTFNQFVEMAIKELIKTFPVLDSDDGV